MGQGMNSDNVISIGDIWRDDCRHYRIADMDDLDHVLLVALTQDLSEDVQYTYSVWLSRDRLLGSCRPILRASSIFQDIENHA
jgi:hypothetical protein